MAWNVETTCDSTVTMYYTDMNAKPLNLDLTIENQISKSYTYGTMNFVAEPSFTVKFDGDTNINSGFMLKYCCTEDIVHGKCRCSLFEDHCMDESECDADYVGNGEVCSNSGKG